MNALASGFADPVFDGQSVFRSAMEALACPGRLRPIKVAMAKDVPILPSAAAVILALSDFETPLYLGAHLAALPGAASFLRFHTGAALVEAPSRAAFAVLDLKHDPLQLGDFAQGTADYPDRSTTIIALCDSLDEGPALAIAGPGIAGRATIRIAPLPSDFAAQWATNRARFPLGIDIIFAAPGQIVGLPRSTRILGEAG